MTKWRAQMLMGEPTATPLLAAAQAAAIAITPSSVESDRYGNASSTFNLDPSLPWRDVGILEAAMHVQHDRRASVPPLFGAAPRHTHDRSGPTRRPSGSAATRRSSSCSEASRRRWRR
jgi:hypothetical protein